MPECSCNVIVDELHRDITVAAMTVDCQNSACKLNEGTAKTQQHIAEQFPNCVIWHRTLAIGAPRLNPHLSNSGLVHQDKENSSKLKILLTFCFGQFLRLLSSQWNLLHTTCMQMSEPMSHPSNCLKKTNIGEPIYTHSHSCPLWLFGQKVDSTHIFWRLTAQTKT